MRLQATIRFNIATTAATLHQSGHTKHRQRTRGRRSASPARRRRRVLTVHDRLDRHRHAGGAVLAGSSAYTVAEATHWQRVAVAEAEEGGRLLHGPGRRRDPRSAVELARIQRDQDAVLVGRPQWLAGPTADRARHAAHQRSPRDGATRQFAHAQDARLADGCDYDSGLRADVRAVRPAHWSAKRSFTAGSPITR